jgi:uncharacterized protein (DUF433 family)
LRTPAQRLQRWRALLERTIVSRRADQSDERTAAVAALADQLVVRWPNLRIAEGRCGGEPHLVGTRLTTVTLAALVSRGYTVDDIVRLYPEVERSGIEQAIEFELNIDHVTSVVRQGLVVESLHLLQRIRSMI